MRSYTIVVIVMVALAAFWWLRPHPPVPAPVASAALGPDPGYWKVVDADGHTLSNAFPSSANVLTGDPVDLYR